MSAESRILALIGTSTAAGSRIYATQADDVPALPFVVFQRIVATPVQSHEGTTDLTEHLFQFSCYAATHTAAVNLRAQIRTALEGNHTDGPILLESLRDSAEGGTNSKVYRADADFTVWNTD